MDWGNGEKKKLLLVLESKRIKTIFIEIQNIIGLLVLLDLQNNL